MRLSSCLPWLAAGAFACHFSNATAQQRSEDEDLALLYGDKSSVSIATGSKQPLRRAPAVATVITAQDMAAMGATDLDEVLETVPGIHVSHSNQAFSPLYVIRGIYSEFNPQTLVLQNGVPLTAMFIGSRGSLWAGLPVENIARIEVIRGPGSALYGADAYAGVINIITKSAADIPGTEVGLRAGSFNTVSGWVQHGGKLGPFNVAAYFQASSTDGQKRTVTADAQSFFDPLFGTNASLAPGPVNAGYDAIDANVDLSHDKVRLRLGYKLRDKVETGAGAGSALDPVGRGRTDRIIADLSWNDLDVGRDWKLSLTGSCFHQVQKFPVALQLFPPGAAFSGSFPNGMFGAPNTWERQLRLSAVASYSGFAGHNLRLGAGHDDLDMYKTQEFKNFSFGPTGLPVPTPGAEVIEFPVADSFLAPVRRKLNYVYVQDEWNLARDWTLTAGLRRDQYSDFGGTTNPRLALVWDASLDVTAKLLYGRAFRGPSLTEQYSVNNPVIRGNPHLKPETISTLEAALAWQVRADTQLNLSIFRYRMNDIIRTSDAGGGTTMFNNVGSQRGRGLELEAIQDLGRNVRVAGHYAYQRSIDDASGQDAGYAPHHHLFGRLDWGFASGWLASGQVNHVAGRKRAAGDARPDIADYTTLDLSLRINRGKDRWELAASVRNLFNADVREPSLAPGLLIPNDLPMAPRSLYIQALYRL